MLLETVAGTDVGTPMTLINVVGDTATPGNSYINEYSAMTVPSFWSGVRFLAETMASFRRSIHQELPNSRVVATNHPLNTLLRRRISSVSSPYRTIETWVHHAVVWGNGYLHIQRDSRGNPVGLLNLNPDLVAPFVFDGEKYFFYKGKDELVFNDDDVLHISLISFDGIRGYPMVQLMRYGIETAKLAEMFTKDYLERGTFMSGSIQTDKALTKEQLETLKTSVKAYSSPQGRKRFQMMILDDSKKLVNSTIPNQTS
jgi:HK97 family phage portal protein